MLSTKQHLNEGWSPIPESRQQEFWDMIGIWEPLIVSTKAEADFLFSMQLMIGKAFIFLLDGVDEPIPNMPPTYLKIDIPL